MPRRAAPPKQTSLRAQSEPDSDSDAPEAVSLASAQKAARQQAGAVEAFKAAERAKVKAKRRERDERGKERARDRRVVEEGEGERGFAGEGEDEEARRLQERMARAMEEAGGESGSEDEEVAGSDEELLDDLDDEGEVQADEEDEDGEEASDAELEGDGEGTDDEFSEGDDDDDDADSEASSDAPPIGLAPSRTKPSSTPRHLPDALFASAFASQSAAAATTSNASRPAKRRAPAVLRKNVKRARKGTQDVVVGSRTIRTLSSTIQHHLAAAQRTVPPPKVEKFAERNLGLTRPSKGKAKANAGTRERRPANIGVLKRSGPAAHFARSQS